LSEVSEAQLSATALIDSFVSLEQPARLSKVSEGHIMCSLLSQTHVSSSLTTPFLLGVEAFEMTSWRQSTGARTSSRQARPSSHSYEN
jgi:hypothetical protein